MQCGALKYETRVLIPKCWVARTYFERFFGLMGKKGIPGDEAFCFHAAIRFILFSCDSRSTW